MLYCRRIWNVFTDFFAPKKNDCADMPTSTWTPHLSHCFSKKIFDFQCNVMVLCFRLVFSEEKTQTAIGRWYLWFHAFYVLNVLCQKRVKHTRRKKKFRKNKPDKPLTISYIRITPSHIQLIKILCKKNTGNGKILLVKLLQS